VHQSARVKLNGERVATVIGPVYKVLLEDLREHQNLLEVEVTNLAANRIRHLDRIGAAWKRFEDINFVDRNYQPFDAADRPIMPSGLLGPVKLISLGD
jgi:hypothetical protein